MLFSMVTTAKRRHAWVRRQKVARMTFHKINQSINTKIHSYIRVVCPALVSHLNGYCLQISQKDDIYILLDPFSIH